MVDILHKVGIKSSSLSAVYGALTTLGGLAGWWTAETRGDTKVGGVIEFRFDAGGIDMKVRELVPDQRVVWEVVAGPDEWIGTTVRFDLQQEGDWTLVRFKHEGWKEPVDFMHHCSTKWGVFLLSLKSLLETGHGSPAPNDIKLDSRSNDMNESEEPVNGRYQGGCACRAVRYEVSGPPVFQNHCQCRDCQQRSGTGHGSYLTFAGRDKVKVTGAGKGWDIVGDSGNVKTHSFCPTCGTPVYLTFAAMPDLFTVHAASLDDPGRFAPQVVTYATRGHAWDQLDPALTRFDTMPGADPVA